MDHAELVLGGSGAIVAAGAARLGLRVAMAGCVGDDALGRAMLDALDGVDVSAVRVGAEPTGVSVGLARPGDRAVLTALGALAEFRAEHVPDALLASARWVHVASPFLQPGLDVAAIAARAAGTTSLDPGWDPTSAGSSRGRASTCCCPTRRRPNGSRVRRTWRRRRGGWRRAGRLVVVKLGADGALAAGRRRRVVRPGRGRCAVDPVDATGAGDSFDAGFIAARLAGEDLAGGARARLRVRRAQHAGGGRDRGAADAGRSAILPRVIAFVAASPSIDRTHVVDALTPGEIHRPQHVVAVAGGKALNAARAAHALGADVHAIALLGGHTGRWVAAALEEEGVTCDAVAGPGETRICLSVSDGEALTEFYEPGPELDPEHWAALEAAAARIAAGARWVGIAGSLPPGAPADAAARLIRVARQAGARVALDVSGEALRLGLAAGPDFVKVNAAEAAELGFDTAAELREAAAQGLPPPSGGAPHGGARRRRGRRRHHARRRRHGARDARRRDAPRRPAAARRLSRRQRRRGARWLPRRARRRRVVARRARDRRPCGRG